MTKFLKKSKKPYSGAILGPFCQCVRKKKKNSPGKRALLVFKYSNYLPLHKKNRKKLMIQSSEKCKTDGQTDNSDFMGPSVGGGSKKKKPQDYSNTNFCHTFHS